MKTYRELKEELDSLTKEQLEMNIQLAIWKRHSETGDKGFILDKRTIKKIGINQDKLLYFDDDDALKEHELKDFGKKENDAYLILPKGQPTIFIK